MDLYASCISNKIDPEELSKKYAFWIRPKPKERGDLSWDEWEALRFDLEGSNVFALGEALTREELRARNIQELPNILQRAAAARKARLEEQPNRKRSRGADISWLWRDKPS